MKNSIITVNPPIMRVLYCAEKRLFCAFSEYRFDAHIQYPVLWLPRKPVVHELQSQDRRRVGRWPKAKTLVDVRQPSYTMTSQGNKARRRDNISLVHVALMKGCKDVQYLWM
jgi:hypothetical protein